MHMQLDLAHDRIRSHYELSRQAHSARQQKALTRAKRAERRAERRLLAAWQTRHALESDLGLAE